MNADNYINLYCLCKYFSSFYFTLLLATVMNKFNIAIKYITANCYLFYYTFNKVKRLFRETREHGDDDRESNTHLIDSTFDKRCKRCIGLSSNIDYQIYRLSRISYH